MMWCGLFSALAAAAVQPDQVEAVVAMDPASRIAAASANATASPDRDDQRGWLTAAEVLRELADHGLTEPELVRAYLLEATSTDPARRANAVRAARAGASDPTALAADRPPAPPSDPEELPPQDLHLEPLAHSPDVCDVHTRELVGRWVEVSGGEARNLVGPLAWIDDDGAQSGGLFPQRVRINGGALELRGVFGKHLGTVDRREEEVRFQGYLLPRVYRYRGDCSLAELAVGVAAVDRIHRNHVQTAAMLNQGHGLGH